MLPVSRHRGIDTLISLARQMPLQVEADGFLFLRHGETDANLHRIFQAAEQPLNARGLAQAAHAGGLLTTVGVERIVASSMRRARETAAIVGNVLARPITFTDGLRERWFGDLVGTSSAEIDWAAAPPNGERIEDFVARARAGLEDALRSDRLTLVVAHGGTLHVLAHALDVMVAPEHFANGNPLHFARRAGRWQAAALEARADAPLGIS